MNKLSALIIFSLCALVATAAEVADYRLEVEDFDQLKVTDGVNIVYTCSEDSAGWVCFSCTPELADRLLFTNNKSQLHIQVDLQEEIITDLPTLHVYSRGLTKVENSSDSTIIIEKNCPVQSLKIRQIGNGMIIFNDIQAGSVEATISTGKGHLVLNGNAGRVKLSNVGTGPIEAGNLVARNVKVIMLGTGGIDCHANESISVYGAGSGKVYYAGNPEKVTNRSLGVKSIAVDSSR
ncbi:MAG: DUF2807 domain-containing protein [Muribaculaceae bacterium]|nr:DUF2807 domain-containing protein [Muribaculaceae bacterium]